LTPADRSTPAKAKGPPARSSAGQATRLDHLAEAVHGPPHLLVRVLDELGDQLAGLAAGRVVLQRETSMLVLPPRSSNRTASALPTSASPTLRQAMRWLGMFSVISASHSTDSPSGPETFQ
jgi:hypothetical protein